MADVQIAVGLGREARMHAAGETTAFIVRVDDVGDEVAAIIVGHLRIPDTGCQARIINKVALSFNRLSSA